MGTLELYTAAIDADQAWLAVVAVVNTVGSLYYLRVIEPAVLEPADGARTRSASVQAGVPLWTALTLTTVATVGFGIGADPLLRVADRATMLMGA